MLSDVLSSLIKRATAIEEEMADLEEIRKQRQEDLDRIMNEDIPAVLHENGLLSAPLADGRVISIEQMVNVSQQDKRTLAAWLEGQGYDSVIRTNLEFPKGSDLSSVESLLRESGVDYTKEIFVHPMTLKKVIREHIEAGGAYPPEEALKVSIFERAKIRGPK